MTAGAAVRRPPGAAASRPAAGPRPTILVRCDGDRTGEADAGKTKNEALQAQLNGFVEHCDTQPDPDGKWAALKAALAVVQVKFDEAKVGRRCTGRGVAET